MRLAGYGTLLHPIHLQRLEPADTGRGAAPDSLPVNQRANNQPITVTFTARARLEAPLNPGCKFLDENRKLYTTNRKKRTQQKHGRPSNTFPSPHDSHGHVGELLLGEVEGVAGRRDAVLARIPSRRQISSQDGVVGHAEEGHHAVPRLVVEPHLQRKRQTRALRTARRERLCSCSRCLLATTSCNLMEICFGGGGIIENMRTGRRR